MAQGGRGDAQVVVGARSAIFAPLKNLGVMIIDEEHEAAYKQESNPRYHAREVAILRAQYNQATLVLGSATPSLESRARAGKGVYQHLRLTQRANPLATIPEVQVIDFRDYIGQNETSNFTPPLLEAIQDRLVKKSRWFSCSIAVVILALSCVGSVGRWILVPTAIFL